MDNPENMLEKLKEFEKEQENILKDLDEKLEKTVNIKEVTKYKIKGLNKFSKNLMKLVSVKMLLPGPATVKATSLAVSSSLAVMSNLINPNIEKKKDTKITVTDYEKELNKNLDDLSSVIKNIKDANKNVQNTINDFYNNYKDYFEDYPECVEIYNNMLNIMTELETKSYEIETLKKQKEKQLEKNNAKVLAYGK